MGLIGTGLKLLIVAVLIVFLAPGLPPHYDFQYLSLPEPPELTGVFAPNNILDKAKLVDLDKDILGPESVAIRSSDEVYTGARDGSLVRIKNGKVTKIGAFGDACDKTRSNEDKNLICGRGRIAGVRFDSNGKLLGADAVNGIFRVDVDTGKVEKIVSMNKAVDGDLPGFPNDLDIDKSGNIYWSDSSTICGIDDLSLEALAGPSGRLVKYDAKSKRNTVLISKLHFANGVQLSPNEDFVLVSELMRARVMRYYLKGKNQGQSDTFIDNLPGLPDNIRPNGSGGFYITLAAPRIRSEFSQIDVIGKWPITRRFIVRLQYFLVQSLLKLQEFFPNVVLDDWILYVKRFGPAGDLERTMPFKSIVVETDGNGKIIGTLQNEKGPITQISEVSVGKDWTYFGSPVKPLFRIKTSDLVK